MVSLHTKTVNPSSLLKETPCCSPSTLVSRLQILALPLLHMGRKERRETGIRLIKNAHSTKLFFSLSLPLKTHTHTGNQSVCRMNSQAIATAMPWDLSRSWLARH